MNKVLILFSLMFLVFCKKEKTIQATKPLIEKDTLVYKTDFIATQFDFPVGKPNAKGYYNAQKFRENNHLGEDWNAVTGGNSDLGQSICAIANGYVSEVKNYKGGWGKVVRVIHQLPNDKQVESLYAHCDTILVKSKSWIKKGTKIATIGNVNGLYLAHLHLEIRSQVNLPIGAGYSPDPKGYINPTEFIEKHRKIK